MTLFSKSLAIHDCQPGQRAGQCGEMKIIRIKDSAFVFVLPLMDIPQRLGTEPCSHSVQITRSLSDAFMQLAFLRVERMKELQAHEPHTAPTFMLPICAILTGISWHAFVGVILLKQIITHLKQIITQMKNSHLIDKISRFSAVTKSFMNSCVPGEKSQFSTRLAQ